MDTYAVFHMTNLAATQAGSATNHSVAYKNAMYSQLSSTSGGHRHSGQLAPSGVETCPHDQHHWRYSTYHLPVLATVYGITGRNKVSFHHMFTASLLLHLAIFHSLLMSYSLQICDCGPKNNNNNNN